MAEFNDEQQHRLMAEHSILASDFRKAAAALAQDAVKALFLVNGGAVVAILAFMGNSDAGASYAIDIPRMQAVLGTYAIGLLAAIVASAGLWMFYDALAARSQSAFDRASSVLAGADPAVAEESLQGADRAATRYTVVAVLALLVSGGCFFFASIRAVAATHSVIVAASANPGDAAGTGAATR